MVADLQVPHSRITTRYGEWVDHTGVVDRAACLNHSALVESYCFLPKVVRCAEGLDPSDM